MAETLPGWSAPVFTGMAEPPQYKGVPLLFFASDVLGSLFGALCLVQMGQVVYAVEWLLGGAFLYVVMRIGMKIEPRWWRITLDYLGYAERYEG